MREVIHQTMYGPWSKARLIDEIERLNKIIDERNAKIRSRSYLSPKVVSSGIRSKRAD